jgi:hypothetical protein
MKENPRGRRQAGSRKLAVLVPLASFAPQHYLLSPRHAHVEANLGYWLETLNADGRWNLELTAAFTVQRAIQLRAFERL